MKNTTIPAINKDHPNEYTSVAFVPNSSGPGFKPRSINAPAITAAGADPGTPNVTSGIMAAGAAALFAISDAVTPLTSPLPNWLLSLLHLSASL